MKFLLDTNTCVRFLNGRSTAIRRRFDQVDEREIVVCSVVEAEMFYGAMRSSDPVSTLTEQQAFLDRFVSLPFNDAAALEYGRIRALLESAGTPIGPNDLMIAAIAPANDRTLVTHNTREFNQVPGLRVEDWEAAG